MKTPPKRLLGPFASLFVGPTSVVLAPFPDAALRLSNRRLSKPGDVNAEPGIGTVTNGTKSQSSALRSPQSIASGDGPAFVRPRSISSVPSEEGNQ